MRGIGYIKKSKELEEYFDRTANSAWGRLTSDAPVSAIRRKVRAGRSQMQSTLLSWLDNDLREKTLLDAGCGAGLLTIELARRGAQVVAVDLSPNLLKLAKDRLPADIPAGQVSFRSGDMLSQDLGRFDHVICMDSVIHYKPGDVIDALSELAQRTEASILFSFAPANPLLSLLIGVGRLFPRNDRAPFIELICEKKLRALIKHARELTGWSIKRTQRISSGVYISQAVELVRN